MKRQKIFSLCVALLLCFSGTLFSACENAPKDILIDLGDSQKLTLDTKYAGKVEWSSSNEDIAVVENTGTTTATVLAKSRGNAVITATAGSNTFTYNVSVKYATLFEVSFDSNGYGEIPSVQVKDGSKMTAPKEPDVTGLHIENWYKDSGLKAIFNFDTEVITARRTLYAKWSANVYKVSYDFQGADAYNSESKNVPYGSHYTLEIPIRLGYEFLGWFSGTGGNATRYTDSSGDSMNPWLATSDMTLYASWTIASPTAGLTFVRSGAGYAVSAGLAAGTYIDIIEEVEVQGNIQQNVVGKRPEPIFDDFGNEIGEKASYRNIVIPETYQGLQVVAISERGFENCYDTISITIPSSVTTIGKYAFRSNKKLTLVSIPSSLTRIESYAFNNCLELELDLVLPNAVSFIGDYAFSFTPSLKSVKLPLALTNLRTGTFLNSGIKSVEFPENLSIIGNNAFNNCENLVTAVIPDSVLSISGGLFNGCTSLKSVTFGELNKMNTVPSPAPLGNCPSLEEIKVHPENEYMLVENGVLFNKDAKPELSKTSLLLYPAAMKAESYTVPSTVRTIGLSAFNSADLGTVVFSGPITSMGDNTFQRSKISSITIPSGFSKLPKSMFADCANLTSITIPNSIATIGYSAFQNCTSLNSVTIPNSVTSIESYAFFNCVSLRSVSVPARGENFFGLSVFDTCNSLEWVYFSTSLAGSADVPKAKVNLFNKTHESFRIYVTDQASANLLKTDASWSKYVIGGLQFLVGPPPAAI